MSTPAPPVRDPAWSLSRSAIGLWVTEGVIGTLVWAALVTALLVFVPARRKAQRLCRLHQPPVGALLRFT